MSHLKQAGLIFAVVAVVWLVWGQSARIDDPTLWQERADTPLALSKSAPIAQTFTSQRDNLSAIAFRMDVPQNFDPGSVTARLFEQSAPGRELTSGPLVPGTGEDAGYFFFQFNAQTQSRGKLYIVRLEQVMDSEAQLTVWGAALDEYSGGQALQAGKPLSGDLAFKGYYQYTLPLFVSDLADALAQHSLRIVAASALFLLPGLALLLLVANRDNPFGPLESLAIALGLSMALAPIMLLLVTLAGFHVSPPALWLFLLLCALIVLWRALSNAALRSIPRRLGAWEVATLALFAASLAIDLAAVREVSFPIWTDSYHHTLITQLIIERGQVPNNWQPYFPFDQFTYHFGFHALSAYFAELAQLSASQSVVIIGQIVNALTGLTLYGLVVYLTRSPRQGFLAVAAVLFVNHIPAFIVNWGRYTQLAGQTLLPVFLLVILYAFTAKKVAIRWALLAGVLTAGLFLMHYRVLLFGLLFLAAYGLVHLRPQVLTRASLGRLVPRLFWIGATAGILAFAWIQYILLRFMSQRFLPIALAGSSADIQRINGDAVGGVDYFDFQPQMLLDLGLNWFLVGLVLLGLLITIRRRDRLAIVLVLWTLFLVIGANVYRFGPQLYSASIILILLYIPAGILAAVTLDALWQACDRLFARHASWRLPGGALRAALVSLALVLFGMQRIGVVRWENEFVRPADQLALQWIQSNTAPDARFVASSLFWQPATMEGRDAGWWLPLLARRGNDVPVQLYRDDGTAEYVIAANQLARAVDNLAQPSARLALLRAQGIRYIYAGSRPSLLAVAPLLNTPGYRAVYHAGGVYIFEVE